jgi:hypothetical protein
MPDRIPEKVVFAYPIVEGFDEVGSWSRVYLEFPTENRNGFGKTKTDNYGKKKLFVDMNRDFKNRDIFGTDLPISCMNSLRSHHGINIRARSLNIK